MFIVFLKKENDGFFNLKKIAFWLCNRPAADYDKWLDE